MPLFGKTRFCKVHDEQRRCRRCNRRLGEHLYDNPTDGRLCNACFRSHAKWVQSGRVQSGRGRSSVNHTFITDDINIPDNVPDPLTFIRSEVSSLADSLREALKSQGSIKWYPSSSVSFTKKVGEDVARISTHFNAPAQILLTEQDIDAQLEESIDVMLAKLCDFVDNGSDYTIDNLDRLEIRTATYNPVGGSSYIPLPDFLANKQGIVNVKNIDDDICFQYSILAQLYPSKNNKTNVCSYKKHLKNLNMTGIDVPVKIASIPRFEHQNPTISIGVQTLDENNRIVPLYASRHRGREHHVNLFYLSQFTRVDGSVITHGDPVEEGSVAKNHYCLVTDLGRLLYSSTSCRNKCFPCIYCLHRFYTQHALDRHIPLCSTKPPCLIVFPSNKIKVRKDEGEEDLQDLELIEELLEIDAEEKKELELIEAIAEGKCPDNILCYKNQQYEFQVPFCVYADFESFIDENDLHMVSGFCIHLTSIYDLDETPYCYSGSDPLKRFFEHSMSIRDKVETILGLNLPMDPLTEEQEDYHERARHRFTCT